MNRIKIYEPENLKSLSKCILHNKIEQRITKPKINLLKTVLGKCLTKPQIKA